MLGLPGRTEKNFGQILQATSDTGGTAACMNSFSPGNLRGIHFQIEAGIYTPSLLFRKNHYCGVHMELLLLFLKNFLPNRRGTAQKVYLHFSTWCPAGMSLLSAHKFHRAPTKIV